MSDNHTARECLSCGEEIQVTEHAHKLERVVCPECSQEHGVTTDAELVDGQWHNLTTLRLLP